ncbi:MAG: hypothetical protein ACMXYL_05425 [Candidatus Woesearchaeota archaeon]
MTATIKAYKEDIIQYFESDYNNITAKHDILKNHGTVHIAFPQILKKQASKIINSLGDSNIDIYMALKSTYSPSLIREAALTGLGAEVSSLNELSLAIKLGFKSIIAGGPKNNDYLNEGIKQNTIISVDSMTELMMIADTNKEARIMLRISDPESIGRDIMIKTSRFGIPRKEINRAIEIIGESNGQIILLGFHHHADGYDAETRKGFVEYFLRLASEAENKGIRTIRYINIGGGYRQSLIANPKEWIEYTRGLEKDLLEGNDIKVWGNYAYGMTLSDKGNIKGRTIAESKGIKSDITTDINTILSGKMSGTRHTIRDILYENDYRIIIEPGFALSTTAGMTMMNVIGTKITPCYANLVLVDGNIFSLSTNMIEHITDPELITGHEIEGDGYEGYIIGNLCREDDFIIKRKIRFPRKPVAGDKIAYYNTGSYAMSYEQCNPQRQPKPAYIKAIKEKDEWMIEYDNQ